MRKTTHAALPPAAIADAQCVLDGAARRLLQSLDRTVIEILKERHPGTTWRVEQNDSKEEGETGGNR